MKKSEFINLIKEAIVPEIRKVVREEVKSLREKKIIPSKVMEHGIKMSELADNNKISANKKVYKKKSFSKNTGINKILNETAKGMSEDEEYKTLGGKPFTGNMAQAMGMNPDEMFGNKSTSAESMIPEDKKHIQVPEAVQKALTRDYSQLVQAMDKKKV